MMRLAAVAENYNHVFFYSRVAHRHTSQWQAVCLWQQTEQVQLYVRE